METLEEDLKEEYKRSGKGLLKRFVNYVINNLIADSKNVKPLQVGAKMPDGKLLNHLGKPVSFSKLLNGQPAIISFYRGSWCPYCNLELKHYDRVIASNTPGKINMFAISPEKPDVTMDVIDIEKLNFKVLSDKDNEYAGKLGLVYKITNSFIKFIVKFKGENLKKSQGNSNSELPIPATYIIDDKRIIKMAWLDNDFTKRAEPSEVIKFYNELLDH